ncbi:MAG: ATP-binding protein [Candidatus Sulfotelmatobacter sp.]
MKRILLSWSSGKDSAWCLHVLRQRGDYEVVGLLTTFNDAAGRVAMHGVRRELVERQADAAGLPLWAVPLPWPCSNEEYEAAMGKTCAKAVAEGIGGVAFGDLFLEDVRAYREKQMQNTGLQPIFPLWRLPTAALAREMIASGMRAKLTCVDAEKLDRSFVDREFDEALLTDLPSEVDPCGERGEFHSFVYAGPMLSTVLPVSLGQTIVQGQFVFADVLPAAVPLASDSIPAKRISANTL